VIGCGPVGIAVIAGLSIKNVHPIIAADFSPARRALALRMGADIVVDPAEFSPYQSWHDAATPEGYDGSRYAQLVGRGPKQRPAVIFAADAQQSDRMRRIGEQIKFDPFVKADRPPEFLNVGA